jgi:glycosyltransferase involved in cell wall biosynthesis
MHVTHELDFGGAESHLQIIAETPGKRFSHDFVAIGKGGAAAHAIAASGAPATALGIDPHRRPLAAVRALYGVLRRQRPDVIHTHGAEGNMYGLVAAALARIPVRIGEEIGMPVHSPRARFAFRSVYRTADRVIGVADAVRDWLIESREVSPSKAVRIYNPVGFPGANAAPRDPGQPLRIGFVGRLDRVKNPAALILAVAAARHDGVDCEAVIIGDGVQRTELEDLCRTRNVADSVEFAGYLANPHALLSTCHLYAQPSLSEGFGIALVEAMGCALPVIASPVGGMDEIVDHGRTGWLLPEPSAEALAAEIRRAAAMDGDDLAAVGRAARSAVAGRFTPAAYISTIETLYEDLLRTKGL